MPSISETITAHRPDLGPYEDLYKHLHAHPELSFQEKETAATIVQYLQKLTAYEVHSGIGGHGVAAVLRNGPGKTILLRADMDGLPVEEQTGLAYASTARMKDVDGVEKPVMHACGHDVHITALLAAAETLVRSKEAWSGTVVLCFQPAEERAGGAENMVNDGLYEKVPEPDVVIGGHVTPLKAGMIGTKKGLMASSADSFKLRIEGRQAHASTPHLSIDPIVQASSTILRLQTIVAREVAPSDFAVVTVSAIHAGDAENIIPSHADIKLNIRAGLPETRERVLSSVKRIAESEAVASGNPNIPTLEQTTRFPFLHNAVPTTTALERTFAAHFGANYDSDTPRLPGSEDFGILATSIGKPSCFFLYGGLNEEVYERARREGKMEALPGNHSPFFAPEMGKSVRVGCEGYVVAALTFLGREG